MTYHMEKTRSWVRTVELKPSKNEDGLTVQFPWKLWQAVNSPNSLFIWDEEGAGFSVNAFQFEASVMQTHPGLVVISTFANFRRQMREYGFDWTHCKETGDFTFIHPCFVRGRKDLLQRVVTRRKSKYINRGEANDRARMLPIRRSTRRGRSCNSLASSRNNPLNLGSLSKRSVSRILPKPPNSNQLSSISGQVGCQRTNIGSIRLRHLAAEPQSCPARVEQWVSLVPSSSFYPGFGVPVSAASGRQETLAQNCFDPVWTDAERIRQEEKSWWSECFPWILQQDSDLCRQFEIDNLRAAVFEQSQKVDIPLHFYSDNFHAIPVTTATYPNNLDSSDGFFGHGSESGAVIEIKPIPDDEEFPEV